MRTLLLFFAFVGTAISSPAPVLGGGPQASESRLPSVFRWQEAVPDRLRHAIRAYEDGRFFDVLADLRGVETELESAGRDEVAFLRAVALRGLGWDEMAVPVLHSILEDRPVSVYYPLALLELVEIHYRAERMRPVVDAYSRFFERPLRSSDRDSRRISSLLYEFGTLRSARAKLSPSEKQMLASPDELVVRIEDRRERASDRILYLSAIAQLRSGLYAESLRTLQRIGIESPYYPYALYATAQNLFALGEAPASVKMLSRLVRYPEPERHDRALESRARILQARILFRSGATDRGIRAAASLPADDPEAAAARLEIAAALVDNGEPALALAYAGDGDDRLEDFELDGRRALTLGIAYSDLDDARSAARMLEKAARSADRARDVHDDAHRIAALAEDQLRRSRAREDARRADVADGVRRVVAFEDWGSWSVGRAFRLAGMALGLRPHGALAKGTGAGSPEPVGSDEAWRDYLTSAEREAIDLSLLRLRELERGKGSEAALRIVNAYLTWLDHGADPAKAEGAAAVVRRLEAFVRMLRERHGTKIPAVDMDRRIPLRPQIAAYRKRLATEAGIGPVPSAALTEARKDAAALLRSWRDAEIREFFERRSRARERLKLDLEMALVAVLADDAGAAGAR